MSEVKKIATRESYGRALTELGREHEDIVVMDADLAGSTKSGMFQKEFPDRFFDVGIAEANMTGIAAGLAASGKVPFISSFAMFATGRAYEQIRNSVAYPHLNVKICASHAGISVGEDGATHQCIEDIALMRIIPGMTVINPADDVEAKAAVRAAFEMDGPVYLRFGRLAVPVVYDEGTEITLGKAILAREGSDHTVIACGLMVNEALQAAETLEKEGISVRVLDMHTLKPLDEEAIVRAATETKSIITAEEHSVIGGLGAAVASVVARRCPTKVSMVGVQDRFGQSGKPEELKKEYQLTAEDIADAVRAADAEMK
jgi:transketolase